MPHRQMLIGFLIAAVVALFATFGHAADEPTFESVQEEFRQKAISLLSDREMSTTEFQSKLAEIANATFGSHPEVMKKEAANRYKSLPQFPAASLTEFVEHKSWEQFPMPPAELGLAWVTFGWEAEKLADLVKKNILSRTLTPEEFGRRAFVNACCPDKIYRLGEGEYPNLVLDSLGDLFVIEVEMTEAGVCKPVSVKWMNKKEGHRGEAGKP